MNRKRILSIILAVGILSLLLILGGHPGKAQDQLQYATDQPNEVSIIPDFVSIFGGPSYSIAYQDHYAYVGSYQYLLVLDVADPSQPVLIGQSGILPDIPVDLAVVGNYAYIVAGTKGLWIYDISHPEAPTQVGFLDTPDYAGEIVVSGDYAYIADGQSGLRIIDITDPTLPKEAGFYDTPNNTLGVSVDENYVYLADGWGGLRIIDASDAAHPFQVGITITGAGVNDVAVSGNYAYVSTDSQSLLYIIDISDPAAPIEVGSYVGVAGSASTRIMVAGNYAYITAYTLGYYSSLYGCTMIIDISDPTAPKEASSKYLPASADMVSVGDHVYIAGESDILSIIDVSDPANPKEIGAYDPIEGEEDITIAGKYAYVAVKSHGLRIIDISNPLMPTDAGSYDTPGSAYGVVVSENFAYVADTEMGLRIIDVSDPAHPVEAGFYDTPCYAIRVAVSGSYAYVGDLGAVDSDCTGLRIIDISNPSSPTQIGYFALSPLGDLSLSVKGSYAYLLGGHSLVIVDISNPSAPKEAGRLSLYGNGIDVSGNYAYVISGAGGCTWNANEPYLNPSVPPEINTLSIFDVSHPTAPVKIVDYCVGYSWGQNVSVTGDYAFIANGYKGLAIIDISNPKVPTKAGVFAGIFNNLEVVGNNVYLTNGTSMVILRLLTDKVSSTIPATGGSLSSTDGATKFIFPSGAFTDTVSLTYRQLLYDENVADLAGMRHTFDLSAMYSDTWQAATIAPGQTFSMTLNYTDTEVGPPIENTLAFYNWDGVKWEKESTSSLDPVGNLLTATPNHLSLWAVLGETNRMFLGIVSK